MRVPCYECSSDCGSADRSSCAASGATATSEVKKRLLLKRKDLNDFSEKMRYSLFNRIRGTTVPNLINEEGVRMRGPALLFTLVAALFIAVASASAQTANVASDSFVNLNQPASTVGGAATTLFVRNTGAGGVRRTFLRFDLGSVPTGVPVAKATLRLYVGAVDNPGSVDLRLVQAAWSEATLNSNNAPSLGPTLATLTIPSSAAGNYANLDVTSIVANYLAGATSNLCISLVPGAAGSVRVDFNSKENAGTSHAPEIEV